MKIQILKKPKNIVKFYESNITKQQILRFFKLGMKYLIKNNKENK